MVAYRYATKVAFVKGAINTLAANTSVLVYALTDTGYTTPLVAYSDRELTTITNIVTDENGIPETDFFLDGHPDCRWKSGTMTGEWATTQSRPGLQGPVSTVPGPPGPPGSNGTNGLNGSNGATVKWATGLPLALGDAVINPDGDLVTVTTAHTAGGSYDSTKFNTPYDAAVAALVNTSNAEARAAMDAVFSPRRRGASTSPILAGKLRGGNIVPKPGIDWPHMFAEWDWDNWIKPQVDRAVALGLNAIRLIGAARVVFENPPNSTLLKITQAQYDARWSQLAQYCLDCGLDLYPCLSSKWDFDVVATYQDATRTAAIKTTAAVLSGFSNVIGFDLFQEGDANTGVAWKPSTAYPLNYIVNNGGKSYKVTTAGTSAASGGPTGNTGLVVDGTVTWLAQGKTLMVADVLALFEAVRSVSKLPLTMSRSIVDGFGWNDSTSMWFQVFTHPKGADFVDIHVYPEHLTAPFDNVLPSDPDFQLFKSGKPFLIGEFGVSQNQTTALQASRFNMGAAIHNRRGVLGSFIWGLADQKTSANPENQWGVYDNTGFAQAWPAPSTAPLSVTSGKRTTVTDLIPRLTIADRIETAYKPQNLLDARRARPRNSISTAALGWLGGGNTYLYAETRGLGFSALAAGVSFVATTSASIEDRIAVSGATYYQGKVVLLAGTIARAVSFNIDWYDASDVYISSSTAATGTDSTTIPLPLTLLVRSHTNAVYARMIAKVTDVAQPANEAHILLEAELLPAL